MRKLWAWLRDYALIIAVMFVASLVTTGKVKAQQRPAPTHLAYNINGWGWPVEPAIAPTEYTQPFIYSKWWAEIAVCEGFPPPDSADQAIVQFFRVESRFFALSGTLMGMLAGTFDYEPSIYVGAPYVWEESVIKHEMLHVILKRAGFEFLNFHPQEFFEKCGIHTFGSVHD